MNPLESRQTAMQISERPPMYWEAVRICQDRGMPYEPEDVEQARMALAVAEFRRRIEPYTKQSARIMSLVRGSIVDGQGYVRANLTLEQDKMLAQVQELIDHEAKNLGLAAALRAME